MFIIDNKYKLPDPISFEQNIVKNVQTQRSVNNNLLTSASKTTPRSQYSLEFVNLTREEFDILTEYSNNAQFYHVSFIYKDFEYGFFANLQVGGFTPKFGGLRDTTLTILEK